MATEANRITETDLVRAIAHEFPSREYALLRQVTDGTGAAKTRSVDALAISLWPSRGIHIHGFECKCDRGDWLRERKAPEKAGAIAQHCDFFWLVTADEKVALPEELPKPWGLYVLHGGVLRKVKSATRLMPDEGAPIPRAFVAAAFRRAQTQLDQAGFRMLEAERLKAITRGREQLIRELQFKDEQSLRSALNDRWNLRHQLDQQQKLIDGFQAAAGIDLREYRARDPRRMGELFKTAAMGAVEVQRQRLESVAKAILETLAAEPTKGSGT